MGTSGKPGSQVAPKESPSSFTILRLLERFGRAETFSCEVLSSHGLPRTVRLVAHHAKLLVEHNTMRFSLEHCDNIDLILRVIFSIGSNSKIKIFVSHGTQT